MLRRDSVRVREYHERGQRPLAAAAGRHDFSCGRIGDVDWRALEVLKRDASSHLAVGLARSAAVAAPGGVRVAGTGGGTDTDANANIYDIPDLDLHEHSHSFTYTVTHQDPYAHPGAHTYAARAPAGGGNPPRPVALLAGGPSVSGERRIVDAHPGLCR